MWARIVTCVKMMMCVHVRERDFSDPGEGKRSLELKQEDCGN